MAAHKKNFPSRFFHGLHGHEAAQTLATPKNNPIRGGIPASDRSAEIKILPERAFGFAWFLPVQK
jgi:hypothetical protein